MKDNKVTTIFNVATAVVNLALAVVCVKDAKEIMERVTKTIIKK